MKTRKMKRFATIAAIAMIASCVAMPMAAMTASAADGDATITIDKGAEGATYGAYRLLNLTTSKNADDTLNYNYTVNETYKAVLVAITGKTDDADIVDYISKLTGTAVQDFADQVYAKVKGMAPNVSTDNDQFTVAQGYYLIVETATADNDTFSLVMLDTNGQNGVTVETKEAVPVFEKKVFDINDSDTTDSGWGDSADHDMTNAVKFKLTATLPTNYASYNEYKLVFHDAMQDNVFSYNNDAVIYIQSAGEETAVDITALTPSGCTFTSSKCGACDMEFVIDNVKEDLATAVAGDTIVIEYTATLTEQANIGNAGNWNSALLEYSNDPYYDSTTGSDNKDNDGDGETDEDDEKPGEEPTTKTNEDQNVVFTYQTVINKIDNSTPGNPLTGATFTLEKYYEEEEDWVKVKTIVGDETSVFTFEGLDDGNYRLTEDDSPDGYTKLAAPIEFTVSATHTHDGDDTPLTLTALTGNATSGELTLTPDAKLSTLTGSVVNKPGSLLPSTGGIGTTIFYVVGGTMAAGAGVYLISKKRMKKDEE